MKKTENEKDQKAKTLPKICADDQWKESIFKEYGDPRKMDMRTGEYVNTLAEKYQANEAIHLKIGSGVYGVPRWIGNIVNLYGAKSRRTQFYVF